MRIKSLAREKLCFSPAPIFESSQSPSRPKNCFLSRAAPSLNALTTPSSAVLLPPASISYSARPGRARRKTQRADKLICACKRREKPSPLSEEAVRHPRLRSAIYQLKCSRPALSDAPEARLLREGEERREEQAHSEPPPAMDAQLPPPRNEVDVDPDWCVCVCLPSCCMRVPGCSASGVRAHSSCWRRRRRVRVPLSTPTAQTRHTLHTIGTRASQRCRTTMPTAVPQQQQRRRRRPTARAAATPNTTRAQAACPQC